MTVIESTPLPFSSVTTGNEEALIQYSLTSDDYLDQFIPLIKSELENKNSLDDLIAKLEKASVEKEQELEGVSFDSVDDLTSSVKTISKIVKSSDEISKDIISINRDINKTGRYFSDQKKKVVHYKKLYLKINETNNKINACLGILERTNKVLELVHDKDFYKALVYLDSLSKTHTKDLEQFEFTTKIYKSIPTFKQMIIEETFNQLIKWLNISLEKNLTNIGERLFDTFELINESWSAQQLENKDLIAFKVNSAVERTLRDEKYASFDPLEIDNSHIDLGPLYHSVLVYQTLNELEKLSEDYNNEVVRRRERLISPIKEALANNNLNVFSNNESLKIQIYSICSFFIIDRTISNNLQFQIRSKKQVDDLFDSVMKKFMPVLEYHVEVHGTTVEKLKELNDILGLFFQTLTSWDFDTDRFYKLMIMLYQQYTKIIIDDFRNDYMSISLQEDSQSLVISSQEQLDIISQKCFYMFKINNPSFPITVPFSLIYPATCLKIRDFIENLYTFSSRYYIKELPKIIQLIASSIDNVLIDVILKDLDNKIHSTYKEEVSQNLINLEFFSNSVIEVEKYLNFSQDPMILRTRTSSNVIKLKAEAEFKSIRTKAEDGMFKMVDSKIDMLFEMVEFDWSTDEVNFEPSISIKDMGLYLENMFRLDFSHLPESIKSLLLVRTFDNIATYLKNSLFDADNITAAAVDNFSLDINYVESLIPKLYGTSNDDAALKPLKSMFVGLRQFIELLKEGNLEGYKDEMIRMRKFNTIKPEDAYELINRLEEYQKEMKELESAAAASASGSDISMSNEDDTRSIFGRKSSTSVFQFKK